MVLSADGSHGSRRERSTTLLDSVGLGGRYHHHPSQLSGGEQQRVTIARAIANTPSLLLLDEPTGDLDSKNSEIVMDILVKLNEQGMTLVMVTHDMSLKHLAHRVVHMRDGKVFHDEMINEQQHAAARRDLNEAARQHACGLEADDAVGESSTEAGTGASPAPDAQPRITMRKARDYRMCQPQKTQ